MTNMTECRVASKRGTPSPGANDRRGVNGWVRNHHRVRSCKVETGAGL